MAVGTWHSPQILVNASTPHSLQPLGLTVVSFLLSVTEVYSSFLQTPSPPAVSREAWTQEGTARPGPKRFLAGRFNCLKKAIRAESSPTAALARMSHMELGELVPK